MLPLKSRIARHETTIGSWITLAHPAIAEIMAKAGFDWLTVEMEHSSITIRDAEELIRVIDLCGVVPLVRVGENNRTLIKRVLDAGAHGVIVPMVNSREDAEQALQAARYPPDGCRGVGLARAQHYGLDFDSYRKWNEQNSIVIAQIEHIRAVENLDQILSTGVDGFMIGPYDLSGSLGIPGQFTHPKFLEALEHIRSVQAKTKVPAGYHVVRPNPQLVADKIQEGYSLIAYSDDFLFLGETCRQDLQTIRAAKHN